MSPLLDVQGLTKEFGGLVALSDVSFTVESGEIRGLIGPNGAGKTTLFNCITGSFEPTAGRVELDGKSLVGLKPHKITRSGIARTFQQIRLFANMTALENVMVGGDSRRATRGRLEHAFEQLEFVGIAQHANSLASAMSYGDQRRLEIARALATSPRILLLDEPAAGMNPAEKAGLMQLIRSVRDRGVTVLLIEHDMKLVMGVCERVAVLDFGQKIADGLPEQIRSDPRVIEAYLGAPSEEAG